MLRKFIFPSLLLLTIGILCWRPPIFAHDAFYPHHREDFESMTRRRELRGTVLVSTVVFLSVLAAVVYLALRKSREIEDIGGSDTIEVQERLRAAANSAAYAAKHILNTEQNVAKAAETALTTYAAVSGVTWQPHSYRHSRPKSVPFHIRCKIGQDIVTLSISAEAVELKAEHDFSKSGFGSQGMPKSERVVLRLANEEGVSCEE